MSGKKRKRRKPKKLPGFEEYTTYERCEDCDLRNALDIMGRPIMDRRKGPLTRDCEGCGGTGKVKRTRVLDPYLDHRRGL
jgi:hypothetical protein